MNKPIINGIDVSECPKIDKIIDYFLKNTTKPVGKPYIWVSEEAKELLNEEIGDIYGNKEDIK